MAATNTALAAALFVVAAGAALAATATNCCEQLWPISTSQACENDDGFPPVCLGPCSSLGYEAARCVDGQCRCKSDGVQTNLRCPADDGYPSACIKPCTELLNFTRATCVDQRCRCMPQ